MFFPVFCLCLSLSLASSCLGYYQDSLLFLRKGILMSWNLVVKRYLAHIYSECGRYWFSCNNFTRRSCKKWLMDKMQQSSIRCDHKLVEHLPLYVYNDTLSLAALVTRCPHRWKQQQVSTDLENWKRSSAFFNKPWHFNSFNKSDFRWMVNVLIEIHRTFCLCKSMIWGRICCNCFCIRKLGYMLHHLNLKALDYYAFSIYLSPRWANK